uniref:MARVEL domain-containing protein n=1 Tax=viral metagenome TaxID=1070528 RepID=A0A6C0F3Q3_9ZZZZ
MSSKGSSRSSSKSVSTGSGSSITAIGLGELMLFALIFKLIYNIIIILYVTNLENKDCNCITDWRHDFIKYYSGVIILWTIIAFILHINKKTGYGNIINNIAMGFGLINIYCLYTYVGDLEKTKCLCAIEKTKKTHYFLYIWRYVIVAIIILALLSVIFGSMAQIK